jgi:Carboxypeptidase regulatory-like domain
MSMKPKTLIAALLAVALGTWWLLGPYGLGIWMLGEDRIVEAPADGSEQGAVVPGGEDEAAGSGSTGIGLGRVAMESGLRCRLLGQVFDELSEPIRGATLTLHAIRTGAGATAEGTIVARRRSRADGSFDIGGLEVGKYLLKARAEGWAERWTEVWFDAPFGKVQHLALRMMGGYPLQGTVVDPAGNGVAGAWVLACWQEYPDGQQTLHEVRSDAAGRFGFPALPAGKYPLLVWSEPYEMGLVEVDASRSDRVRVQLTKTKPYKLIFGLAESTEPGASKPADAAVELSLLTLNQAIPLPSPVRKFRVPVKGAIEVGGLRAGDYIYECRSEQRVLLTTRANQSLTSAACQAKVMMQWLPGVTVEGKLVDKSGKAMAGIRLRAMASASEEDLSAITDERGHWAFPPRFSEDDEVMIMLLSQGLKFEEQDEEWEVCTVTAGSKDNVLVVTSPPTLSGRVVDDQGRPVPGAYVWLHTTLDEEDSGAVTLPHWVESDAQGGFVFLCEPEISTRLFLSASTAAACSRKPVPVKGNGMIAQEDLIITLAEGGVVEGQVVDDKGVGIPGVSLMALHALPDSSREHGLDQLVDGTACSNRQGLFRITGLPPGPWKLLPGSHDFVLQGICPVVHVDMGQAQKGLRIVMTQGLSISGRLRSPKGEPLSGISIQATLVGDLDEDEPGAVVSVDTVEDGSFEIQGLRAGMYELLVEIDSSDLWRLGTGGNDSDDSAGNWYSKSHRKGVPSGSRGLTWEIALPRFGAFKAHLGTSARKLESLEAGIKVSHGERIHPLTVKDGVVSLSGLLAGSHDVRFSGTGFEDLEMKVDVLPDQVTQLGLLPLVPVSRTRGRVVDAQGRPLAGAWIGVDPALAERSNTCNIEAGPKQFGGLVLTVSDADGRFSLPLKTGGSIYLFKRGYVPCVHASASSAPHNSGKPAGDGSKKVGAAKELTVRLVSGGELRVQPLTSSKDREEESWLFSLERFKKSAGKPGRSVVRWERSMFLDWNDVGRFVGLEPGSYRLYGVNTEKTQGRRTKTVLGESYYEEIRIEAGSDRLIRVR